MDLKNILKMLLTNLIPHDNIYKVRESDQMKQAAVAQSVERRIGSAEVTGPIPVSSLWRAWCLPGFFSFIPCGLYWKYPYFLNINT